MNKFVCLAIYFVLTILYCSSTLYGKNVLITGGNRGIGLALVNVYLGKGFHVYTTYRSVEESTDLLALNNKNLNRIQVDILSSDDAVKDISNRIGNIGLDILIHNAGIFPYKANRGPNLAEQEWVDAFRINSIFPILLTFGLREQIKGSDTRKVIFISSRRGSNEINITDHYEGRYGYRSSKAALNSAVVGLAQDLKGDGIVATMVHPGRVATRMTKFDGISPQDCASRIFLFAESLTLTDTGKFVDVTSGHELPW